MTSPSNPETGSTELGPAKKEHKPRPFIDMLVSIIIPSIILMKFSSENDLGATGALLLALAFPIVWGTFETIYYRKFNYIALLGLISVLLTGGIGLLQLDPKWLAIKEAAIPGIIGIAVLISTKTRFPLIRSIIYNPKVMRVDDIKQTLAEKGNTELFDLRLMKANYLLGGTFFVSSVLNYVLAKWIVVSPAGSTAFNEELGRMTLLSYPVIVVPSMIMMITILYYLWKTIHGLTGLSLEEILVVAVDDKDKQPEAD